MVIKHEAFDTSKGGTDRLELPNDIDTIPTLIDHAADPADLAFDPGQATFGGVMGFWFHHCTPRGYIAQYPRGVKSFISLRRMLPLCLLPVVLCRGAFYLAFDF